MLDNPAFGGALLVIYYVIEEVLPDTGEMGSFGWIGSILIGVGSCLAYGLRQKICFCRILVVTQLRIIVKTTVCNLRFWQVCGYDVEDAVSK